ncbi:MAG: carotenoid 1,2-hydratase [Magnetococcales bacterium]|nr:carotenoid 1,2-hydratase [Magnetococcales bacterium]
MWTRRELIAVLLTATIIIAGGVVIGFDAPTADTDNAVMASILSQKGDDADFERAYEPREFQFPRDHGPHPRFKAEWWYMTGNLTSPSSGRHYGYELTLFRFALAADSGIRPSTWGTSQVYMGHFALTDVEQKQFHHWQRFSREALDLAGANADPFRVWLGNWSMTAAGGSPWQPSIHLTAHQDSFAIDLTLVAAKPVVLQGDHGLSRKSSEPGNASYYYSLPRMATSGWITTAGERVGVSGSSWFDREWSTSSLAPSQEGWDWFSLQLEDGWEMMVYHMREKGGGSGFNSGGTLVSPEGRVVTIADKGVAVEPLDDWVSPMTGIRYPSGWRLRCQTADLDLQIIPWLQDQELGRTMIRYWEGAVRFQGMHGGKKVWGNGYVELAGYRGKK